MNSAPPLIPENEPSNPQHKYPKIVDRIKAAITDSAIVFVAIMIVTQVFGDPKSSSIGWKIGLGFGIAFLYEPLLVSFLGGTVGHLTNGMHVRQESDESQKLPLPFAFLRFAVKLAIGWISLLTVTGEEKRRAMHDLASDSVVLKN